mgnify:FL=1|jgi:hypothetical protein
MKYLIVFIIIATISCHIAGDASGNPFSCKLQKEQPSDVKRVSSSKKLAYKGYAFMKKQQFAIIQIGDAQYTVKQQDKIDEIQVLEISPDTLTYMQNRRMYKVEIETRKGEY